MTPPPSWRFPCSGCGACCRALPPASTLNRGDGTCRHLDADGRCTIYERRPAACRVDDAYRDRVAGRVERRVYYMTQAMACMMLDARNVTVLQQVRAQVGSEEITPQEFAETVKLLQESITDADQDPLPSVHV